MALEANSNAMPANEALREEPRLSPPPPHP
jgi:hypothetical protein